MRITTIKELMTYEPCGDAHAFLKKFRSLEAAWAACENPQWMLWALSKTDQLPEDKARQFACDCAERSLKFFEAKYPNDKRPRLAIVAARLCITDHSTEASAARSAAWSAARSAAESAAESAAGSVARSVARSEEGKWQANHLREIINPFSS
jgi:hypothetical protein